MTIVKRAITPDKEPEFKQKAKRWTDAELADYFGCDKQTAYRTRVRLGITKENKHATRTTTKESGA